MDISKIIGKSVDFCADITGLSYDSRSAKPGDLFFCIKGYNSDGHVYAKDAYDKGVRCFVAEDRIALPDDAHVIYSADTREALAKASAAFFNDPAKSMYTVGITGTKGKTSTSFMIKRIFECAGKKVGLIGTTGIYYGDVFIESHNSTPESYIIHSTLAKMRDSGCDVAIIEASSQGFMMHRTDGIIFDAGVFTNISPDHIGPSEHESFDDYLQCKCKLFNQSKRAYVNADTDHYDQIAKYFNAGCFTFGKGEDADIGIEGICYSTNDGKLTTSFVYIENNVGHNIYCNMPGEFSIYNATGATAVARAAGIDWDAIKKGLSDVYVQGRMEIIPTNTDYTVIIDFAHNALSCEKLFETIGVYSPKRIISIFGCGGNRSIMRRYAMGKIIGEGSDITIVTADNPRTEPIDSINKDIKAGLDESSTAQIYIDDRKLAIETALDMAEPGDCILLIGKGHEDYQEIGDQKICFVEREVVENYLASK